jgi:tellurite resistance protein TehA-like permease
MNKVELKNQLREFFPGYFALAMSTGIISIAAHLLKILWLSNILFWANIVFYLLLLALYIARIFSNPRQFAADLSSPEKGAGFFTIVAATCITASMMVLVKEQYDIAVVMWWFALLCWIILFYSFIFLTIIKPAKQPLEKSFNGSWLLLVVSTQSIAICGTLISDKFQVQQDIVLFFCLACCFAAFLLYLILITIDLYRLCFLPIGATEFSPTYWINTGAAAISTLALFTLANKLNETMMYSELVSFLKGIGIITWSLSTLWIPVIILLEGWRYFYKKIPFKYDAQYWSMVFSLGMYATCSFRLNEAFGLSWAAFIPNAFFLLAVLAWVILTIFMITSLLRKQ